MSECILFYSHRIFFVFVAESTDNLAKLPSKRRNLLMNVFSSIFGQADAV